MIWSEADENHTWRNRRPVFSSKGEKELYSYLKEKYPDIIWKRSKKIRVNNSEYVIDIFAEDLNLYIEYDGKIHFEVIYGQQRLDSIQIRDKIVEEYCTTNGRRMIRIDENTFRSTLDWKKTFDENLRGSEPLIKIYS